VPPRGSVPATLVLYQPLNLLTQLVMWLSTSLETQATTGHVPPIGSAAGLPGRAMAATQL